MQDPVEPARLRATLEEEVVATLLGPKLVIDTFLLHVFFQSFEQIFLKRCQALLRERARTDELIEVLAHEQLNLCNLLLELRPLVVGCFGSFGKQIDPILLQELLHEHIFEVTLVPLRVEAPHCCPVLLLVKVLTEMQCLLRHFELYKKWRKTYYIF